MLTPHEFRFIKRQAGPGAAAGGGNGGAAPANQGSSGTSNNNSGSSSSNASSTNAGAIAGGVIGGLVVIALILAGAWHWRRRRAAVRWNGTGMALPNKETQGVVVSEHEGDNPEAGDPSGLEEKAVEPNSVAMARGDDILSAPALSSEAQPESTILRTTLEHANSDIPVALRPAVPPSHTRPHQQSRADSDKSSETPAKRLGLRVITSWSSRTARRPTASRNSNTGVTQQEAEKDTVQTGGQWITQWIPNRLTGDRTSYTQRKSQDRYNGHGYDQDQDHPTTPYNPYADPTNWITPTPTQRLDDHLSSTAAGTASGSGWGHSYASPSADTRSPIENPFQSPGLYPSSPASTEITPFPNDMYSYSHGSSNDFVNRYEYGPDANTNLSTLSVRQQIGRYRPGRPLSPISSRGAPTETSGKGD